MERRLVRPVGFSKGWAELMLKNPPPFVPSCLMASMKPTGPTAMVCETPLRALWMLTGPPSVSTAPWPTKIRPPTMAMGVST